MYGILERIKAKGYHPVLAHPERYGYMEKEEYRRIKDMGVKLQLNLPSIAGLYGSVAKAKAEKLLKYNAYDIVGGDIHSLKAWIEILNNKISSDFLNRDMCKNYAEYKSCCSRNRLRRS